MKKGGGADIFRNGEISSFENILLTEQNETSHRQTARAITKYLVANYNNIERYSKNDLTSYISFSVS